MIAFNASLLSSLKKLILAPHIDDECLGLAGLIDAKTHVLHFGCAENQNHGNVFHTRVERVDEFEKVISLTCCSHTLLDHPVNNYATSLLITDIEDSVNSYKPDVVFLPNPSYNQDHQAVYDASIIALRPHDINYNPPVVLVYYQPQDLWHPKLPIDPSVYIGVDPKHHLHIYKLLASQVRNHRSPELIESMLRLYGELSRCQYALPFKLLRLTLQH